MKMTPRTKIRVVIDSIAIITTVGKVIDPNIRALIDFIHNSGPSCNGVTRVDTVRGKDVTIQVDRLTK